MLLLSDHDRLDRLEAELVRRIMLAVVDRWRDFVRHVVHQHPELIEATPLTPNLRFLCRHHREATAFLGLPVPVSGVPVRNSLSAGKNLPTLDTEPALAPALALSEGRL